MKDDLKQLEIEASAVQFMNLVGKDFKEEDLLNLQEKQDETTPEFLFEGDTSVSSGKWAVAGSIYSSCDNVADNLEPGVYIPGISMSLGPFLRKVMIKSDDLVHLPDDASDVVLAHIDEFWSLKDRFDELGYLHKRGVMLYGPPGGGKTSTVIQTVRKLVSLGGIALISDYPPATSACLNMVRSIEPSRPAVVVMEDIDDTIRYYGDRVITELLDGEASVDNVLYLATTNYPERLPPRLVNRPSRFDIIQFIGMPSEIARREYLKNKAKTLLSPSELDSWAKKTEGLSIAHLKELIVLVFIYKNNLDESILRMKGMFKLPRSRNEVTG